MRNLLLTFILAFAFVNVQAQLAITEISYNPPEAGDDSLEYIELYNKTNATLDLTNYKIISGVVYTFPNVALRAGQYLVVCNKDTSFQRVFGFMPLRWTSGGLNNSGEAVTIVDSLGKEVVSATYSDKSPWPTMAEGTDGDGASIELCSPDANPNVGSNWKVSTFDTGIVINNKKLRGTPGKINSVGPCVSVPDAVVEVSSNVFTPKDITIDVGQTVQWINKGGNHNVNGTKAAYPNNPEGFGNGAPSTTAWVYEFKFNIAGVYTYKCDPHAALGMIGTVTVKSPVLVDDFPLRTIAIMRTVDGVGKADSVNKKCTLVGTVYGGNLRAGGLQFTIIDNNNKGIGVFNNSASFDYIVKEGDEVEVKGTVVQFNGYTQVNVSAVKLLSSGKALVPAKTVNTFVEGDESSLLRLSNVAFKDISQWTGAVSGFNVTMTDGTRDFTIRIDNDIDLFALPIPTGTRFNVTGLLSQFDNSEPLTDGYQMLPRYKEDFAVVSATFDIDPNLKVEISPNPASSAINITSSEFVTEIRLFDIQGQEVLKTSKTQSIDISNLANGIYLVKASTTKGASFTKVIKQ